MEAIQTMTIQSARLLLRPLTADDFAAIHSFASRYENVRYMPWGPNGERETWDFLRFAISEWEKTPREHFHWGIIL